MTESSESLKITTEHESNKSSCCRAASFIVGHTQYSQYTSTCKMCSNLHAAHQAQTLSWSTGLCSDPACSRLKDRHGLMGENEEDTT